MDVIGYVAVSPAEALTDPLGFLRSGLAPADQQAAIERAARARRAKLIRMIHEHDVTSLDAVDERVGLGEAMELMGAPGRPRLLVARLDRIADDVAIQEVLLAEFRRMGSDILSAAPADRAQLLDPPADPVRAAIRAAVRSAPEVQGALRSLHARLNMSPLADTRDVSAMAEMDHVGEGGMALEDLARVLTEQRIKRQARAGTARGWPRWWSSKGATWKPS